MPFIDSKTELNHNTPELVFQYTTWSALFNGIIRSNEDDDKTEISGTGH